MDRGGENSLRAIRLAFESPHYSFFDQILWGVNLVIKAMAPTPKAAVSRGGLKIFIRPLQHTWD